MQELLKRMEFLLRMLDFTRYETPATMHRQLGLCCTGFGCKTHKTDLCSKRKLGSYAVVWVPSGSGWLETSATPQRLPVVDGTLFWLFPDVIHSYAPDATGWVERWAMFEGPQAEMFKQLGFLSPTRPLQYIVPSPVIDALFAQLHSDFSAGGPLLGVLGAASVYRLVVVAHELALAAQNESEPHVHQMQQIRRWLEEHAFDPQEIDFVALAAMYHMGYSTLRRRFKQATGYSLKEYVLRIRLIRAKELLAFTQQRISDIARCVGFADPYYFSRLFHAREGRSPELFRAQQRHL